MVSCASVRQKFRHTVITTDDIVIRILGVRQLLLAYGRSLSTWCVVLQRFARSSGYFNNNRYLAALCSTDYGAIAIAILNRQYMRMRMNRPACTLKNY